MLKAVHIGFDEDQDGSRPQLYDILKDPSESVNLAAERPTIVRRLSKSVLAWNETLPHQKYLREKLKALRQ